MRAKCIPLQLSPSLSNGLRVCGIFFSLQWMSQCKGPFTFFWCIIGCAYCSDTTEEWNHWPTFSGENWFSINVEQCLLLSLSVFLSFKHSSTGQCKLLELSTSSAKSLCLPFNEKHSLLQMMVKCVKQTLSKLGKTNEKGKIAWELKRFYMGYMKEKFLPPGK